MEGHTWKWTPDDSMILVAVLKYNQGEVLKSIEMS